MRVFLNENMLTNLNKSKIDMIITEIVLNNEYDVTNVILKKLQKNKILKIPNGFDFSTFIDKKIVLKDLFIEYIIDEEIKFERFHLNAGKILKKINIPSKISTCFYCYFTNKLTVKDYDKINLLVDENNNKENIGLIFNIEHMPSSESKNYVIDFDYTLNISLNEKSFEMKYSKGALTKIINSISSEEKFYCFSLTPYFVYKYIYDVFAQRCNIFYYLNSESCVLSTKNNMQNSVIINNEIENIKNFLMLERVCIKVSSKIIFSSHDIYVLYTNFFSEMMNTKEIKTNYCTQQIDEMIYKEDDNNVILLTSTQYPRYGGAATCAYELHKYLTVNGLKSVMIFFDNTVDSKKINIDPDEIGNVYHFKLNRTVLRYNIINDILKFHKNKETGKKIIEYCGGVEPCICLAFNYLAPIISKTILPSLKVYFLITGSKVMTELKEKIPITDLHKNTTIKSDYIEQLAITCSEKVLPNSGITKNIFEYVYPLSKHKFNTVWDMHEIFETSKKDYDKSSLNKIYDIIFISSRYDREIKNINLVKRIYSDKKLKNYKKACIGIDSEKYISKSDNITHLGFLQKEEVEKALALSKIIIITSFMESYSITNRESINNNCISLISKNVGNGFNMHDFFLCNSVYEEEEWVNKIKTILLNYNYFSRLSQSRSNFETPLKTLQVVRDLRNESFLSKKINVLIVSVDLPYVGGSGTNSYNIIKTLKNNSNLNVYGLYFSSSKQKGLIDPEKIGNIYRYDMDKLDKLDKLDNLNSKEKEIEKIFDKLPHIDVVFCKNYKTLNPLKYLLPKSKIIYSPSGLRSVTAVFSKSKKPINEIMENDMGIVENLRNELLQETIIEKNILSNINAYDKKLENYAYKNADIIIPNSLLTYKILKKLNIPHINEKLHNYIPITNISLSERLIDNNFYTRKYAVAFVCHSWKRQCKNASLMFEIIARLNNLEILIIGNNLDTSLFKNNKRVNYYDNLEHNLLMMELKKVKTLVMCSLYDSNPNTVLEAIQCGCNVVLSTNVGGYEFIDESCVVKNYSNIDSWISCINVSLKAQIAYNGPGCDELYYVISDVLKYVTTDSKNVVNEKSLVGVYKIPALLDEQFTLSDIPNDYKFSYREETENMELLMETQKSDIYYLCTLKLSENCYYDEVHYIKGIENKLDKSVFYSVNKYFPIHSKRVYIWYLKNIYDLLNFKGAGLYFLRGTYHNIYSKLLVEKKGNAILYPATSVPFDNSNIMLNPLVNIKKTSNKNLKSNKPYDIVLTNVDENNYNLVYPNSTLLPFYKFSPDSYYLTNSKKRYIDFIFVANSNQMTKNHHLFHNFIKYLENKCITDNINLFNVAFIGDMETVRKNYELYDFGLYNKCINFINRDKINSNDLRELYNNSKVNLLFSGRDAVPRVLFESSACGCYNIALDTLSDGKYFFKNIMLGKLVGDTKIEIEKRPSSSISYHSNDALWKMIYEYYKKEHDHEKIAIECSRYYSLERSISIMSVNL